MKILRQSYTFLQLAFSKILVHVTADKNGRYVDLNPLDVASFSSSFSSFSSSSFSSSSYREEDVTGAAGCCCCCTINEERDDTEENSLVDRRSAVI